MGKLNYYKNKNDISLYIILDSCYSGSFQIVPYDKVKNIKLISSTLSYQKSTESLINTKNKTQDNQIRKHYIKEFYDDI